MTSPRRSLDRARPTFVAQRTAPDFLCCDDRQPGADCWTCGKGPNDQPISAPRAQASNA